MGKKATKREQRDELTADQFQRIVERIGTLIDESPGDQDLLFLAQHIRDNRRLSLDEQKVRQQIKESKYRISTDEQLIKFLDERVINGNFVTVDKMRENIKNRLLQVGFPFAAQFAEMVLPRLKSPDYVEDLISAWERSKKLMKDIGDK